MGLFGNLFETSGIHSHTLKRHREVGKEEKRGHQKGERNKGGFMHSKKGGGINEYWERVREGDNIW